MIVPLGEGARPKSVRASGAKLAGLAVLAFLVSVCITLALLVFTPVAMYVPIPNPGLEAKYGRQILETQQQLDNLAHDVLLLKDYNMQLRKALGEGSSGDSTTVRNTPPSVSVEGSAARRREEESRPAQPPAAEAAAYDEGVSSDAGLESESYGAVVTAGETNRSMFPLLAPAEGFVTQGFDPARNHYGMDFAGKRGTLVCAAGDGHVVFAGWTYDDGNMLIISHGGGYLTVYKHNQLLLKTAQAVVSRGEPIALLGTSGKTSLGPHLHFEVWKDGIPRDPNQFLLTPSRVQ